MAMHAGLQKIEINCTINVEVPFILNDSMIDESMVSFKKAAIEEIRKRISIFQTTVDEALKGVSLD